MFKEHSFKKDEQEETVLTSSAECVDEGMREGVRECYAVKLS